MNQLDICPDCNGTLTTRTSRKVGPESIERRRECACCSYCDIAIVRPAVTVKRIRIPVVYTKVDRPSNNESEE